MRIVHWMLLLSVLLFVTSIWFLVAGAGGAGPAPAGAPVATVKQIMRGIVVPGSTTVYQAVSTVVTAAGTEETAPQNDEEWAIVGSGAVALVEAGRLLMEKERAKDGGDWMKMSQAMIDSGMTALKATQAKNAEALLGAGEVVNMSCDSCHQKYAVGQEL